MKRRTEKKYSAQLLADYAEDHAIIKNAIAVMACGGDLTFMCRFHDKELEALMCELVRKIAKLEK